MAKGTEGYKVRTVVCVRCGESVTKRMPAGRRYCSLGCYRTGQMPQRKTGESRVCEQCGSSFYVEKSRVDKGEGQFCTLACHNTHQGRGKTTHVCKVCGGSFRWSPSRTTSGNYNVTYCSLACRDADPSRTAMLVELNARQQRLRETSAERAGYALLDRLGMPYLRQPMFGGKFTPDATVPGAKLVVQFDGDYWHDRKGTSTEPRILRRVALDRSQDAYVRAWGWEVARLWASDLARNPAGCLQRLSQLAHRPLPAETGRSPVAPMSGQGEA